MSVATVRTMTLRVGILGAGQAGERQAVGFHAASDTTVVAVADLAQTRAAALAQRCHATAYADWREMVETEDLDIIAVCLPHNLHVEPAVMAAARGIHVMMEKPIAATLEDARRIIDVCRRAEVKLTVSFVHRFREEIRLLYDWLRDGDLGRPMLARETMNGQRGAHLPGWVERQEVAGGGVLMYSAIHGIDRLRWLLGSEVTQVTARTLTFEEQAEVEHGAAALLTFENGVAAALTTSAPAYPAKPTLWETEIFGTAGMARARTRYWAEMNGHAGQFHHDTQWCAEQLGEHYNFARQAEAFVRAVRDDEPLPVTAEDGLVAQEIVRAIYASAATGMPVTLKEEDG
jgi:predicted dehydrogenase